MDRKTARLLEKLVAGIGIVLIVGWAGTVVFLLTNGAFQLGMLLVIFTMIALVMIVLGEREMISSLVSGA